MTNRITRKTLDAIVARINTMTNSPLEAYSKDAEGKYRANVGNFHISGAYGGFALHRMVNDAGGVSDVFSGGHQPARQVADRLYAFISGLSFNK
jgi:hypothetical protein